MASIGLHQIIGQPFCCGLGSLGILKTSSLQIAMHGSLILKPQPEKQDPNSCVMGEDGM
jgi:hypothetical protein